MIKKLFLFLGLVAASATISLAQTNNFPTPVAIKFMSGETGVNNNDEITRPRVVVEKKSDTKASAVKSSVMVKIASVEHIAFDMINQKRAEAGLKSLMWSDELEGMARGHSQNMADFNYFSHRSLDGKMVSDRADDIGLSKWRAIGENIAFNRGFADPIAKAVDLWMNSPSHKHNLMGDNWKEAAIGVAIAADGSYYFTQVFLARK